MIGQLPQRLKKMLQKLRVHEDLFYCNFAIPAERFAIAYFIIKQFPIIILEKILFFAYSDYIHE